MTSEKKKHESVAVLEEILTLDADTCEIQLCLASLATGDVADIQRVQISRSLAEEFRSIVKNTLVHRKKNFDKGDLVLKDYDAQAKLDSHEIECIDLNATDSNYLKERILGLADIENFTVFSEDDSFISNLRFYVMFLRPQKGDPVIFFRTYTPKKELNRSTLFAIISRRGTYDRFTNNLFL